jgi:selenophosphate synthase
VAFDPQTSGGLLISVQPAHLEELRAHLAVEGAGAHVVGRAVEAELGVQVWLA